MPRHGRRTADLPGRDPEGKPQQVRVRPRHGRDQARPLPLLLDGLSDRLRLHPGDARAGRRPARRDGAGVGADVPQLRDRREGDRAVPHGGRQGDRRQGAVRAAHDPAWNTLETLDDVPGALRDEIAHFFSVYKDLEQKKVTVDGWYSREDALEEIEASRERCKESKDKD